MLRTRQLIPPLTARTISGQIIHAWDFKQKKNLVIALLEANRARDWEFAERLAARASDIEAHDAVALIIFSATLPAALETIRAAEIILAADPSGRATRAYLGDDAFGPAGQVSSGVFVADRYGELFAQWIAKREEPLPGPDAILSALRQIEIACEECGVSNWPVDG